ncbi:unnamed protein product [Psylliodes chrysocephalus]|uniref:Uncharacterized protein n=1 Tax=Psylliodes chrysocephalus TaxID=3402493 RepID=A0A9P0D4H5_9CUCU|nr:unnamed protein product [Psylliodes chrysocephala]
MIRPRHKYHKPTSNVYLQSKFDKDGEALRKLQEGARPQQTLKNCVQQSSHKTNQMQFNEDLWKAMISTDMPLNKLNNVNLKSFLQNYCKFNVPDESTLRKKHVYCIYKDTNDVYKKYYI